MSPWQHRCCFIKRYMPLEDGCSIRQILAELDTLAEQGYGAIHITGPYDSPGFEPWWGLRVRDPFRLSPVLGDSMEEFSELVRQCHARDLRVLVFLNPGYADPGSELWHRVCRDRKQGLDTPETRYFRWRGTGTALPATPCFPREEWWADSPETGDYLAYWEADGLIAPQFDWSSPDFRDYAARFMKHWLDTGVDCIILDAVNRYLGCDMELLRSWCGRVLAGRSGVCLIPEGATGFADPAQDWLDAGFPILEDQLFHSDLSWNGSAIWDAVRSGSAAELESRLANCRLARSRGAVCWSYLSYGPGWTPRLRLLEIAVLLGTGHMTELLPGYLRELPPEDRVRLTGLLRLGRHPGLAPIEDRRPLTTGNDAVWACICAESTAPVICVCSFSVQCQRCRLPLPRLRDLITGQLLDDARELELEPYGWRFLEPSSSSSADL